MTTPSVIATDIGVYALDDIMVDEIAQRAAAVGKLLEITDTPAGRIYRFVDADTRDTDAQDTTKYDAQDIEYDAQDTTKYDAQDIEYDAQDTTKYVVDTEKYDTQLQQEERQ